MAKDELEVDVGSYLRTLARYWWLLLALVAVGAIAGGSITFLQEKTYKAESSVYLGQPTDANGNAIAGPNSNPKAAVQIVAAESTLKQAAKIVGDGETVANLRSNVVVLTPTLTTKGTSSPVNFVAIAVRDTDAKRAAKAANALAAILAQRMSGYAKDKLAYLREQIEQNDLQLAALQRRSDSAQKALDAIAGGPGSDAQKALASTPYLAIAQAAASERQALLAVKRTNEMMVQTVEGIEQPKVLTLAATPGQAQEPNLKLSAAAGLLVGLVVGMIIALLLEHRRRRAADVA
ncbi:MAG TPA: Wzz/FepE/Etk N-terminal domain-containing protein [Thermoleophilia bacterium]|nr:Wzz/FepE/Etk N-terminal domain-containing protein [Thermoleophilia bacterium]